MAQDNYTGQDDGYLSTDPYAGQAHTTDVSWDTPPPGPRGPNDGYYDSEGHWIPYGSEGPGGITGQGIPGQPKNPSTLGAAGGAYGGDPTNVDTWLQWLATQPGHDPILDTPGGLAYYKQRISETGGLNASNVAYWQNKGTLAANGGAVGAPEGGAGGFGSLWNKMPTLADIQGEPGYQEALAEGKRSYETGAASKGTILNGRTIAGEGSAVANQVLTQFYWPYAQQQYQNNQGNANNLYNLANLGLNGSSVGAA